MIAARGDLEFTGLWAYRGRLGLSRKLYDEPADPERHLIPPHCLLFPSTSWASMPAVILGTVDPHSPLLLLIRAPVLRPRERRPAPDRALVAGSCRSRGVRPQGAPPGIDRLELLGRATAKPGFAGNDSLRGNRDSPSGCANALYPGAGRRTWPPDLSTSEPRRRGLFVATSQIGESGTP